jgi:hypothetical protein
MEGGMPSFSRFIGVFGRNAGRVPVAVAIVEIPPTKIVTNPKVGVHAKEPDFVNAYMWCLRLVVCLLAVAAIVAAAEDAAHLAKRARKAERAGNYAQAFLLYAEAAAADPKNPTYWQHALALRTRASLQSKPVLPIGVTDIKKEPDAPATGDAPEADLALAQITDLDLAEASRPQPPALLKASSDEKDLDLKDNAEKLFEKVAHAYGLEAVFDSEFKAEVPIHFHVEKANYRDALRALEAATGSFVFPVTERVFMVAKDTTQKRQELEPNMAVTMPIPSALTVQEAQELSKTVQMTLQIQRMGVDAQRGLIVVNDKVSKVRPAQALLLQLMQQKPQVTIELELVEVSRSTMLTYGLMMPAQFTLSYFLGPQVPLNMIFRSSLWGLTLGNAELIANMNASNSKSLFHAQLRSVDGQPAALHVGDKYPIENTGYFGQTQGTGTVYTPPPTFTFEDLGLVIKITPHINGVDDVSLDVDAEFKVLSGQGLNGIPIISNRKLDSKVRVAQGQWAVLAGLLDLSDAKSINGIAGLNGVPGLGPLFRQNTRTRTDEEVIILLKPILTDLPPSQFVPQTVAVGSESRPRIPL